jgi:hypothetical protein
MKRVRNFLVCAVLLFIAGLQLNAQYDIHSYAQLSVGTDPMTFGGDGWTIKPEIGWEFKFINVSISGILSTNLLFQEDDSDIHLIDDMISVSNSDDVSINGRTAYSLMFNLGVDFVKLFIAQSKHSFQLTGGIGVTQLNELDSYRHSYNEFSEQYIWSRMDSNFGYCFAATYQYQITEKSRLGIYTDLQEVVEYATFGVNLRRYF